jgi:hypothetical protein
MVNPRRRIKTPEKLYELFQFYKENHEKISVNGFHIFCKENVYAVKHLFTYSRFLEFNEVVEKIKDEIFQHKLIQYQKGLLHFGSIVKEAKIRKIDINNDFKFDANKSVNQFVIENGLISIKDSLLTKKTVNAKSITNTKAPNTVYVLNIQGTDLFKIGTSQNVNRRITDITCCNPFIIDVVHIKKTEFAYEIEQYIHNLIDDRHVKNEWFKLKDIDKIIDIINENGEK